MKARLIFASVFSLFIALMILVPNYFRLITPHEPLSITLCLEILLFSIVIYGIDFFIIFFWLPAAVKKVIENKSEWTFASLVAVPAYLAIIGFSLILGIASVSSLFERKSKDPLGIWVMLCVAIVLFVSIEIYSSALKRKRWLYQNWIENHLQKIIGPDITE